MLSITSLFFPSCADLLLEDITREDQMLTVSIRSSRETGSVSALCSAISEASQSLQAYSGGPALSEFGRATPGRGSSLLLQQRPLPAPRKTFAESFPDLAAAYARRTSRQTDLLRALAVALGGRPGAQMSEAGQIPVSLHTLLRLLRRTPEPAPPTPRVLGVDDWSMRKGETYCTVLVDLERHRIVDVLPDREAETLEAWLKSHPGVEVISRDRAGAYAQGARKGTPSATQVADRFHLVLNLQEALKRLFERTHALLEQVAAQQTEVVPSAPTPTASVAQEAPAASPLPTPLEPVSDSISKTGQGLEKAVQ